MNSAPSSTLILNPAYNWSSIELSISLIHPIILASAITLPIFKINIVNVLSILKTELIIVIKWTLFFRCQVY
jgi:hypothetical protein